MTANHNDRDRSTTDPVPRARAAAEALLPRRVMPIPVAYGSKNGGSILGAGWQEQRLGVDFTLDAFNRSRLNIGMQLGHVCDGAGRVLTDNVADSDLDTLQALRAAPFFLPETRMVWGRESKPRSHYGFRIRDLAGTTGRLVWADPLASRRGKDKDKDKATLAELRFTGHFTLAPGSTNLADGHPELVRWDEDGEPGEVEWAELVRAMNWVCAAALFGAHWPEGTRHDWSGPLAGMLYRGGVALEDALTFQRAICAAAEESDAATIDRLRYVTDTYAKLDAGEVKVTGQPELERLGYDPQLLAKVRTWLGLRTQAKDTHGAQANRALRLTPVSALTPQRITWLMSGYLPAGELSALAGAGGAGKTSVAMSIAVAKAGGLPLPNGSTADVVGPMGVVYITNENHPNKVLRPRLEAEALRQTKGDLEQTCAILDHLFVAQGVVTLPSGAPLGEALASVPQRPEALVLPRDVDILQMAIRERGVGLVIIDPIVSFSARDLDILNPADMRSLLDPMALLAQEDDIALLALLHFSKSVGQSVIMRISLSRQLTDTARAVGVVLEDPDGSGRRWLALAKGNLGVQPLAYSFNVTPVVHPTFPDAESAVVVWGESRQGNADKLEAELAAQAAAAQAHAHDPFGAGAVRGERTKDAINFLGRKLVEMAQRGDVVITGDELTALQQEGGFSAEVWSKARAHWGIKTAPTGQQGTWAQDLSELTRLTEVINGGWLTDDFTRAFAPKPKRQP